MSDGARALAAPSSSDVFDELSLDELRLRTSAKWVRYPPDVLPAWVAEMDFPLAPPIRAALCEAVERDDTGYADGARLREAFAGFAAGWFDWAVDPAHVWLVADVMSGVAEVLRALTGPDDEVVVNPPVYPPFFNVVREIGRRVVEAPLRVLDGGWELDLDAIERAFAGGAKAYLLCNPHNPVGLSIARDQLAAVAELAARYGVLVLADEIHAPMTMPGAIHTSFLSLGGEATEQGLAITGASKAWNLAGLKCAVMVAGSDRMQGELTEKLPKHVPYHVGQFGVLASTAAFAQGRPWLQSLVARLDRNRRLLAELLAAELPEVGYVLPQAGYLAWLDCRRLGLGDDPAEAFLERGRVALSSGPTFGREGNGFARLNFGTSPALLTEAVHRLAATLG